MTQGPFLEMLAMGIQGEEQLIEFLKEQGFTIDWWAEDEAKYTHKGPRLNGLIKPDLLVTRNGQQYWIDSKRKSAPIFYGIAREWRHGIDGKCYWHYLEIEHQTNIPVWIAFIEPSISHFSDQYSKRVGYTLDIGGVWFTPLDATPVRQDFATNDYHHMIYWNRAHMQRLIP